LPLCESVRLGWRRRWVPAREQDDVRAFVRSSSLPLRHCRRGVGKVLPPFVVGSFEESRSCTHPAACSGKRLSVEAAVAMLARTTRNMTLGVT